MMVGLITAFLGLAQLILPHRLSFMPLLIAIFYLGNASILGELTPVRIVIILGILRAICNRFPLFSLKSKLDLLFLLFSAIAVFSSFAHSASIYVPSPLKERIGLVLNISGVYFYAKFYLSAVLSITNFSACAAIVMFPFSLLVVAEQVTGRNYFSVLNLGARSDSAGMRNERFRAKGPFGHAILSGTAAASMLPLMMVLRRKRKFLLFWMGATASILGTIASGSSGPMAALLIAVFLIVAWRWRSHLAHAKLALFFALIILHFVMKRPVWFLIARVDLVGGSTGWHRAMLIDAAIKDINSWWMAGTDYTRHWMFSGVSWNPNHTDITNYYLQFGVLGGLPLMLTFIAIIFVSLSLLENFMERLRAAGDDREFDVWCVWTAIITHAVSFLSIAYFDQSYAGFFLLIGAVPAIAAWVPGFSSATSAPVRGDRARGDAKSGETAIRLNEVYSGERGGEG